MLKRACCLPAWPALGAALLASAAPLTAAAAPAVDSTSEAGRALIRAASTEPADVALAAKMLQGSAPAERPRATLVLVKTVDTTPVDLRVGPHRFRIPRAYFRHPPRPSGVDTGFYLRALWPDMEPETEKTRAAFRASARTEEGRRVLQILLVPNQPGMPWPTARWMLQNSARGPSRAEADRADLEAFAPASPETSGLRALLARPKPGPGSLDGDLFHGALADGRFAGLRCGRDRDPERSTSCRPWFDWSEGTWLQVTSMRTQLPRWPGIADATLALVDGFAVGGSDRVGQ